MALMPRTARRTGWSSSWRFVVVAAAAVVGLSDIWRLPALLENYGGGAFLAVYVGALLVLGLPLFSAQLFMARGSHADVPGVIAAWTRDAPHSRAWVWGGFLLVAGAALLLAAYSVIAAWSLAYSLHAVTGGLNGATFDDARAQFLVLAHDPERGFGWLLLFFCLLSATASRGLRRGVEPVMRTLALCMLAVGGPLLVSALLDANAGAAARSLWQPDFGQLGWHGALEALYQAFFTLSLGTGVIVALASYLRVDAPVIRLSLIVIGIDLAAALAAAFMVAVFLQGSDVGLDHGLQRLFEVLPAVLGDSWRAPLMFVLIALVGISTAQGLFEPVVQLVQQRSGFSRLRSTLYAAAAIALVGLLALLSFGALHDWRALGYDAFGWLLLLATHVIGPGCGLMLCVLVSRVLARRRLAAAWQARPSPARIRGFAVWHALLRYPTRIALLLVVAYALGGAQLIERLWQAG